MIDQKIDSRIESAKPLFSKGRLWIKNYPTYIRLYYKQNNRTLCQKIYKQDAIKDRISSFLVDAYYQYEYNGKGLLERELALLILLDVADVHRLIQEAHKKIKKELAPKQ